MQTDSRWPRLHTFVLFGVQFILIIILLGVNSAQITQWQSMYWMGSLQLSAASVIFIFVCTGLEFLALIIQLIWFLKNSLSPAAVALAHGCFSVAWLAVLGLFFASEGMYSSLIADSRLDGSPNSMVAAEGGFVTMCFLASLYVTLFSAYIFLRRKHSPLSDARSPDVEAAEYVPVIPPKGTRNTSQAPVHFANDKQEAALPQDSHEALQYPFMPQELPNSNARPNPNRGTPKPEDVSSNTIMVNGILYQAVPNTQAQTTAYGVQPSQDQAHASEKVPELQASALKRKPVELGTGSVR